MHGVTAQTLHPEQEGDGCLELRSQEQHLEVQEGLLAGREVRLSWGAEEKPRYSNVPTTWSPNKMHRAT